MYSNWIKKKLLGRKHFKYKGVYDLTLILSTVYVFLISLLKNNCFPLDKKKKVALKDTVMVNKIATLNT